MNGGISCRDINSDNNDGWSSLWWQCDDNDGNCHHCDDIGGGPASIKQEKHASLTFK